MGFENVVRAKILANATCVDFRSAVTSSIAIDAEIQWLIEGDPVFDLSDNTHI